MTFQDELNLYLNLSAAIRSNGRMLVMDDLLDGTRTQTNMTPVIERYQNWSDNCNSTQYSNITGKGPFMVKASGGFCSEGARSTVDFQPGDEINAHVVTERESIKHRTKAHGRLLPHDDASRVNQDLSAYAVGDQGSILMSSGFSIQ